MISPFGVCTCLTLTKLENNSNTCWFSFRDSCWHFAVVAICTIWRSPEFLICCQLPRRWEVPNATGTLTWNSQTVSTQPGGNQNQILCFVDLQLWISSMHKISVREVVTAQKAFPLFACSSYLPPVPCVLPSFVPFKEPFQVLYFIEPFPASPWPHSTPPSQWKSCSVGASGGEVGACAQQ